MALKSMRELALAAKAEWDKMTPEEREEQNRIFRESMRVMVSPPVEDEDN